MNKRILCFGDSNTWGYCPATGERYPETVRWTGKLAELTGDTVIEEGLNGRTSIFPDPLLPWGTGNSYIEACVCSHQPIDLLIIMLGTNDMKTYVCNCPDASAKGIAQLAVMARRALGNAKLEVLLIASPAIGEWAVEIESTMLQLNEESIANSRRLAAYLKEQARLCKCHFMDASEYVDACAEDAVHLSEEAHEKLANAVKDKVSEIFQ